MATTHITGVLALVVAIGLVPQVVQAQQPGITRTNLQRHDLSVPGREVVQVRVDFAPGGSIPPAQPSGRRDRLCHRWHDGVSARGQSPATLKPGEVLFIPAGVIHAVKNTGKVNAAELATYIVEKGKPLVVPAKLRADRELCLSRRCRT